MLIPQALQLAQARFEQPASAEQYRVSPPERATIFRRETAAPQPRGVQPADARRIAANRDERRHVPCDIGKLSDHRKTSDAYELLHADETRNKHVMLDLNVPGQASAL